MTIYWKPEQAAEMGSGPHAEVRRPPEVRPTKQGGHPTRLLMLLSGQSRPQGFLHKRYLIVGSNKGTLGYEIAGDKQGTCWSFLPKCVWQ